MVDNDLAVLEPGVEDEQGQYKPMDRRIETITALYNALPDDKKQEAVSLFQDFVSKANQKPAYQPPPLPVNTAGMQAMDMKTYNEIFPPKSRVSVEQVLNHVKENFGPWLASVHPELKTDAISRLQIKTLDNPLYNKLNRLPKDKVAEVIQTDYTKKDKDLEIPEDTLHKAYNTVIKRKMRAKNESKLALLNP